MHPRRAVINFLIIGIWSLLLVQAYRGLQDNVSQWFSVNLSGIRDLFDFQGMTTTH